MDHGTSSRTPDSGDGGIVLVGVGRFGASLVHGLGDGPEGVKRVLLTASPTQAAASCPELIRPAGSNDWRTELAPRLGGARALVAVADLSCREAAFVPAVLSIARERGTLAVAMLVEPLLASSPHRSHGQAQLIREVVKSADSTVVASSALHPPANLSISEAMEAWDLKVTDALRGLVSVAADSSMCADPEDLAAVLSGHGRAAVGSGTGKTVEDALSDAVRHSLATQSEIETACSVLGRVVIGGRMALDDARRALPILEQLFPRAEVRCSVAVGASDGEVRATLVAGKLDVEAAQDFAGKQAPGAESHFFRAGDPSVYEGESLDIPAFVRKGVLLPGGRPLPVPEQRSLFEAPSGASV